MNVEHRTPNNFLLLLLFATQSVSVARFPADSATGVNRDTHMVLTFQSAPTLGKSGQIRIYDASNDKLVDTLDLRIPPGPTAGATGPTAPYTRALFVLVWPLYKWEHDTGHAAVPQRF